MAKAKKADGAESSATKKRATETKKPTPPRTTRAAASTPAATQNADESQADEKEEKRESSTFKQLKAGLNKPASQGLGEILGTSNQSKKGNTGFGGGNQQIGRNQTFGADVNRAGVPRRTGG